MYRATNSTPEPVFITQEKKFLIVPIIFRKQIEKFMETTLDNGLGFLFGDDKTTFSIIKKVWTIEDQSSWTYAELLQKAHEIAAATGMTLLGFFYNRGLATGRTSTDALSEHNFTSVELVMENGVTKEWVPHTTQYTGTIVEQKIIL